MANFIQKNDGKRNRTYTLIKCGQCGTDIIRRIDTVIKCQHQNCKKCTKKNSALKGALNPDYVVRRKCLDCGKELTSTINHKRERKRCKSCFDKYHTKNNHWNWQDGRSDENKQVRNSIQYKEWAKAVKLRDNYTCQICNKRGGVLHSDHIKPFCIHVDLRFDVSNGRTLCQECHYIHGWSLFEKMNPRKGENANKYKGLYRCSQQKKDIIRNKQGVHILCLNNNKVYFSYNHAAKSLGIDGGKIPPVVKGERASLSGYRFQYLCEDHLIF